MTANIDIRSGDAYTGARRLTITVRDSQGATVDLTGTTLTFSVNKLGVNVFEKTTPTDIELASPQSGATKGVAYLALPSALTADLSGIYDWELEAVDAVGAITLADGRFDVLADQT